MMIIITYEQRRTTRLQKTVFAGDGSAETAAVAGVGSVVTIHPCPETGLEVLFA